MLSPVEFERQQILKAEGIHESRNRALHGWMKIDG